MGLLRLMEMIFFLYFLISVPIAILFDSQAIAEDLNISKSLYPEPVVELGKQYVAQFKDPYFLNPPSWYKALVFSEILVQMPFCVVASIAMLLGN
ncbi:tmem97 [Bugula neritina]|uniref:Tmem97 n=1 Tax=Bugula neritina TaxID=10212 RepID=A0A7J7JFV9_BUGNE|nr:tmem97 [Bugula neritina]